MWILFCVCEKLQIFWLSQCLSGWNSWQQHLAASFAIAVPLFPSPGSQGQLNTKIHELYLTRTELQVSCLPKLPLISSALVSVFFYYYYLYVLLALFFFFVDWYGIVTSVSLDSAIPCWHCCPSLCCLICFLQTCTFIVFFLSAHYVALSTHSPYESVHHL